MKLLITALLAASLASAATPDQADRQRILDAARDYASHYIAALPNFFCERVTSQFEAGKHPDHWRQRDTLTSRLVFSQGREEQSLALVNGKPVNPNRRIAQPLTTEGEFGVLLSNLLDGGTFAEISWSGWEDLNGRRLAVFSYLMSKEHSTLSLALGGTGRNVIPYRGLIYTDAATGEVWRVTNTLFDIPPGIDTQALTTTIDYAPVSIADRRFVLPANATIQLQTGSRYILNKISFQNYRKFETESKITFLAEDGSR